MANIALPRDLLQEKAGEEMSQFLEANLLNDLLHKPNEGKTNLQQLRIRGHSQKKYDLQF